MTWGRLSKGLKHLIKLWLVSCGWFPAFNPGHCSTCAPCLLGVSAAEPQAAGHCCGGCSKAGAQPRLTELSPPGRSYGRSTSVVSGPCPPALLAAPRSASAASPRFRLQGQPWLHLEAWQDGQVHCIARQALPRDCCCCHALFDCLEGCGHCHSAPTITMDTGHWPALMLEVFWLLLP